MSQLEQLATQFSSKLIQERAYTKDEINAVIQDAVEIIKKNRDKSLSELTTLMIEDTKVEFQKLVEKGYQVPVPGMIVGLNTNQMNITFVDGKIEYQGEDLTSDSLFDIASMTKLYTAVISYHLMDEGYYYLDTRVKDICPKFKNLENLTIGDLMQFNASFKTPGRIDDATTSEEAKEKLYGIEVKGKNYEYNDFHTIILKELEETITGKTYQELLEQYIIKPLGLNNTYLKVPDNKKNLITGTANKTIALPNDPKAIILGSGGHAGIFASNNDIIQFSKNLLSNNALLNSKYAKNLVVASNCLDAKGNIVLNRGMFGSTYVNHELGLDKTFLDRTFFPNAFAFQGSTRTQGMGFSYQINNQQINGAATILQNPASTDFLLAKKFQEETNKKRESDGKAPIQVVKEYHFVNEQNQEVDAKLVDARTFVSVGSLDSLNKAISYSLLKMPFLNYISAYYEPNYEKTIEREIRIR